MKLQLQSSLHSPSLDHLLITIVLFLCFLGTTNNVAAFSATTHREISNATESSGMGAWMCYCASTTDGFPPASNCTGLCNCKKDKWTCTCTAKEFSEILTSTNSVGCFSSCNCTTGTSASSKSETSGGRFSSSAVVSILIAFVIFTTVALVASVVCLFIRKDKIQNQSKSFSTDNETSVNSFTNLISHPLSSSREVQTRKSFYSILGFIFRKFYMLSTNKEILPGSIVKFSYAELEQATSRFSDAYLIGHGSSCAVYYGQLKDGTSVAVKRLNTRKGWDFEMEFLTEIELLSRLHHFNIVPFVGYCSVSLGKYAERLLVFEYMPNGTLRSHLDGILGEPLDWVTRVRIALGAAKGLEYLHDAAAPKILHRDVKSSNVLLDSNWRAKITDLGMAKRVPNEDHSSYPNSPARMLGTFGYFAPEYAITGRASLKSDVFSFGVVLLELISGRQPISVSVKNQESLVLLASPILMDSKRILSELPDPLLKGNFPEIEMLVMSQLARECLSYDPDSRPTMSEVVQILSTITPDKRMRSVSLNYFQHSLLGRELSLQSSESEKVDELEAEDISIVCNKSIAEELKKFSSARWSERCAMPSMINQKLRSMRFTGHDGLSGDYVEKLILLTSRARSMRSVDDETVDLTEPRFETFWEANVHPV